MALPGLLPFVFSGDRNVATVVVAAPSPNAALTGTLSIGDGIVAATAPLAVVDLDGEAQSDGILSVTAPAPSFEFEGRPVNHVDLDVAAALPTFTAAGSSSIDGVVDATAPLAVSTFIVEIATDGQLTVSARLPTTTFVGRPVNHAGVGVAAPMSTFTADGSALVDGSLGQTAPLPIIETAATASISFDIEVTAPAPVASLTGEAQADGLLTVFAPLPVVVLADEDGPELYPTYRIEVDWNNDGDYADGNEDVTEDINGLAGVAIQYGRDSSQPLAPTASGAAGMELDNTSERYTPANESSPLFGLLLPGRPVRMRATIGARTYTLFEGHTDDSPLDPDISARSIELSMLDALAKLRGQTVTTDLYSGLRTGVAIGHVLDAAGWPAELRDIDIGASVLPWWWAADVDAYEALVTLVASEGPPALLSVGSDGEIIFRDRHHRLVGEESRDVQSVWRGRDLAEGSKISLSWADVINHVEFEVAERFPDGELSQVWQTEDVITITSGETRTIKAMASEPFTGAITPQLGVDYLVSAGAVTVTLTRTSGQVTDIRILASGGPATLQGMALRAHSLPVARTHVITQEDASSVADYGRRTWPGESHFANIHDARAQAAIIIGQRATPRPTLTAKFQAMNAAELAHQIARDLSERIEIVESTALAGQWFIDSITHRFDGRVGHETTMTCDQVPRQMNDAFLLGSATQGVLGSHELGRTAQNEIHSVFIIGSSTNARLGTNLLGF